jgi:subtilisin family serine protease
MEESKNPGLGVKKMHRLDIRGKGMSVAIIDKPINPYHTEFEGRIEYTEVFDTPKNNKKHFHGIACASILAGKSCGILPEATLWYFAVPDDGKNSLNYLAAFEKLFEIDDTLPEHSKIRAVSISDAINLTIPEVSEKWPLILEEAGKRNIAIICSDRASTHKYFTWGGSPPGKDSDNPESYTISPLIAADTAFYRGKILIPSDFRTTAGNNSDSSYTYWGTGGFSWAIPWITGMLTAGWSINPDLTTDDLYNIMIRTKTTTSKDFYTICPEDYIREVKLQTVK